MSLTNRIASACARCMTMLGNGVKADGVEEMVKNRDVLEPPASQKHDSCHSFRAFPGSDAPLAEVGTGMYGPPMHPTNQCRAHSGRRIFVGFR